MKTDTPETDSKFPLSTNCFFPDSPEYLDLREFTCNLERERNALLVTNEKLDRIIELLTRPRILSVDPLDELAQLNERFLSDKAPVAPGRPHDYIDGEHECRCGRCGSLFLGLTGGDTLCKVCGTAPTKFRWFRKLSTSKEWKMPANGWSGQCRPNPGSIWTAAFNQISDLENDPTIEEFFPDAEK